MICITKIIHDRMCLVRCIIHYECRDFGYLYFCGFQILLYDVDFQKKISLIQNPQNT